MVGGFNPSEKYESHLGLLFPIHMERHKIPWFQSPPTSYYPIKMAIESSLIYPAIKWIFSIVMLVYQRVNTLNEAMEDGNEHERDERQNLGFWSPPD